MLRKHLAGCWCSDNSSDRHSAVYKRHRLRSDTETVKLKQQQTDAHRQTDRQRIKRAS